MEKENDECVRILVSAPLGIGGVTNMMINIQSHIDRSKLNFDYLTYHDRKEDSEDIVVAMGSHKLVASVDNIPLRPLRRIARINEIRKVCKKNNIKILHYNADNASDVTNILGARIGGVKYITIHSHNAGFGTAGKSVRLTSRLLKPLIPVLCDNYWGCSDLAARFLFPKRIIDSGSYSVLPNGIELDRYDYNPAIRSGARKELGVEGRFVVGHAGRFSDQKNHSFMLDIFQKIHEKEPNSILLLFGIGELFEPMKEKAKKLGIYENTIFYGASNEMDKMWQAMDVFLMPSLHEGLPVTGIEAQASGLPCVFADTITKEVDVTKRSRFLSLNDSVDTWADAVLSYKGQERTSGKEALLREGYDIQQTADKVMDLYLGVAASMK